MLTNSEAQKTINQSSSHAQLLNYIRAWVTSKQDADKAWQDWIDKQNELVRKHGGCVKSSSGFYYRLEGVRTVSHKGNKTPHPDGDECERLYDSMQIYSAKISDTAKEMREAFIREYGEDVIRVISV